ncbi:MAG: hypothetical protein M1358_20400 [Chloroflexi bacterium]|nr:hypothetical protein [Chloroflexota bacterium]
MLETIRDIAIIFLAVVNTILLLLLVILVFLLLKLVKQIQGEVPVVFDKVKRTLNTVEGTTEFIGKTTVMPIIRVSSAMAAASRFAQVMFGMQKHKGR